MIGICPQRRPARARFASPAAVLSLMLPLLLGGCGLFGGSKPEMDAQKPAEAATPMAPASTLYTDGVGYLQKGEYEKAGKAFGDVEVNYPYSTWASHAQLLHGYAEYKDQNFTDALGSLGRFIQLHPASPDVAYAYYLRALCYYEQIEDVQRDQTASLQAIQALQDVITRFPDSSYARDAKVKLNLATNRLAGHDMAIGRFYEQQNLYAAAVGRFQSVIADYQTTTYVPEALERLVECYLKLGLVDEAKRTASVLAYNYPGNKWYAAAYNKLAENKLVEGATPPAKKSGGFFFGLL
jgi:outer membrane protein assembly factor BamD